MTGGQENPYRVLDVERTADARSIKKAYVAQLRKFPPETHPAEFEKIRAAYELLQDADAKARFDASEKGYAEYGEDTSQRLADVDAMIAKGKLDVASEMLEDLARLLPDARMIKEKLGFVRLMGGQPEKALAAFRELSKAEPENPRHYMSAARALGMLQKVPETEAALRSAHGLAPGDVAVTLSLSGFLIAHRKASEAEPVLEATLAKVPPRSPPFFHVHTRRIEMLAVLGDDRLEGAVRDLAAHVEVARAEHPELPSFVSSDLATTAAKLFAAGRPHEANRVLSYASTFNPESIIEHPVPPAIGVRTSELREAMRTWLSRIEKGGQAGVLRVATWPLPVFSLLVTAAAFLFALHTLSTAGAASGFASALIFTAIVAIPFALSLGWCAQIVASPVRSFDALHPLYLIRVRPLQTRIYSLLALTESKGVHNHRNGVYTATHLTLVFGAWGGGPRASVSLSIRGKQLATDWLGLLSRVRTRALELLAEGALEAEELVELLPPRAAARLSPPARGLRLPARSALVTALAAIVVSVPLAFWLSGVSRAASEAEEIGNAAAQASVLPYQRYMKSSARPLYARESDRAEDRIFDLALSHLRANTDTSNPAAVALASAVDSLRRKAGLTLSTEWRSLPGGRDERGLLASHLQRSVESAGLAPVLRDPRGSEPALAEVAVRVSCETTSECRVTAKSECRVTAKIVDATRRTLFEKETRVAAAVGSEASDGDEAMAVLVERALEASTHLVGLDFALAIPVRAVPLARAASSPSASGGRR